MQERPTPLDPLIERLKGTFLLWLAHLGRDLPAVFRLRPADRQRRMHGQARRALGALAPADRSPPRAAGMLGEVEVGTVLDAQHRVLPLRASQRAPPVRCQDVLRRHLRVRRLVDQPVAASNRQLGSLRRRERRCRMLDPHLHALHQSLAQARIARRRVRRSGRGPRSRRPAPGWRPPGRCRRAGPRPYRSPPAARSFPLLAFRGDIAETS